LLREKQTPVQFARRLKVFAALVCPVNFVAGNADSISAF